MDNHDKKILVIDVGGTNVKVLVTGQKEPVKIPSGPKMTARKMVNDVRKAAAGWEYSAVSIGYPGPVIHGHPLSEPHNLGSGWVGFDFNKKGRTYEDYLGVRGLERLGKKKWRRHVAGVVGQLKNALEADYVVLGGGNAKLLKDLPPGARLGDNSTAFIGGFRLWEDSGARARWKKGADRTVREIPSAETPKEASRSSETLPVDNAF